MRSFLFVPADSERKLARGLDSGADALILDLEDSVAAGRKEAAREGALAYLQAHAARAERPRPGLRGGRRVRRVGRAWSPNSSA